MATKANIIKVYAQADSAKKVDIIIRYYPNFMGIVESYTDGLRYMIENDKAFKRKEDRGDLGVRVQSLGNYSDITGNSAVANVMTREALIACDFSGNVLDGVDRQEEYKQEAFTLQTMRKDYELFNQQLGILGREEREVFRQFIKGEKDLQEIAEDKGIVYESAQQRIHRAKRKIKVQMIGFLDGNIGGI